MRPINRPVIAALSAGCLTVLLGVAVPSGAFAQAKPDAPAAQSEAATLKQIVLNLLDNALKYSDGAIDLAVNADNRELIVSVKDRGPGVSEAEQETIFEPYARGEQSGHRGAGLGLAVCRAIAAAHGGRLTFRRRAGGGSCFSASLPIEAQQPEKDLP